jgi:hypothetical protein
MTDFGLGRRWAQGEPARYWAEAKLSKVKEEVIVLKKKRPVIKDYSNRYNGWVGENPNRIDYCERTWIERKDS